MAYSGLVTYGAVQIQNLEGYRWGITGAVMAMIPLNSVGLHDDLIHYLEIPPGDGIDDPQFLARVMIFHDGPEALAALGVGVWVLTVLLSDTVVKGYAYKAD